MPSHPVTGEMSEREEALLAAMSQLNLELSDEAMSEIAHLLEPYMQSDSPTAAQRIRFGLRQIFGRDGGINEAIDNLLGRYDPPDDAFTKSTSRAARRPAGKPPRPPIRARHRTRTHATNAGPSTAMADAAVSNTAETTSTLMQELRDERAKTAKLEEIAEKNAQEALRARKLDKQLEQQLTFQVQAEAQIAELRHALMEAETRAEENVGLALEAVGLKEQIRNLQAQLEAAETANEELEKASEEPRLLAEHFARISEMEQKLRTRAEGKANDLQQTIYITEAELGANIKELMEILQNMLTRAKEGTARIDASNNREKEELAARVTKLSEELAREKARSEQAELKAQEEKALREQAELKASAVSRSEAEMASLRTQLEEAREAERQAELRAEKAEQKAKKAGAQATRNIGAAAKVIELTHQLRRTQESERQAQAEAEEARQDSREAELRARENDESVLETARLKRQVRALEDALAIKTAAHERILRIIGHTAGIGRAPSSRPDTLPEEVLKAFHTLQLKPPSSPEELKECHRKWVKLLHSDRQRSYGMAEEGDASLTEINLAVEILADYFETRSQRHTA